MAWFNDNWGRRVEIEIDSTHVDSALTDFPVLIDERSLPATFWNNVQSDGGDVVVTSSDGTTQLDSDLAEWDSTNNLVTMRVRIPTLSSSANTVLYLYYDNAAATETDTTDTYRTAIEGYYPLGEDPSGSAPQMNDRCATPAHATSVGSMTTADLVDAQVSKGIDFDGSNDYLWSSDPTKFTFGNSSSDEAFSFGFWFNADSTATGGFVGKCASVNEGEWYAVWGSSKIYFRVVDDSTNGYLGQVTSNTYSTGTWRKAHCTYDGSGNAAKLKIYVDSVLQTVNTSSSGSYTAMQNTADNARIANRTAGGSDYFNGKMDEVTIYREELTADYIKADYRNEAPASYTFYTVGTEEFVPIIIDGLTANAVGGVVAPTPVQASLVLTTTPVSAIGDSVFNNIIVGLDWYDTDYTRRIKVSIDHTEVDVNLTDYILQLDERNLPASFWTNVRSDGYDVLVTDEDQGTVLPKDTSEWDGTAETFVTRVKVAYVSASANSAVYLYYGNAAASSDLSTEDAYSATTLSHYPLGGDPDDGEPSQPDRITTNAVDMSCWTMNATNLVDGVVGKCLDFVGSGEYCYGDDSDVWSFGDGSDDVPFSVSLWVHKDAAVATSEHFMGKTTTKTDGEWYILTFEDDVYIRCLDKSTGGYIGVKSVGWNASTWYKLDATYDGSGLESGMKIYRDGVELSTTSGGGGTYVAMENTDDRPRIAAGTSSTFVFNGKIDDVFLHGDVSDADHIKAHYLNEKASSTFYNVGSEEEVDASVLVVMGNASAIGGVVTPTVLAGSLSLTATASAIGDTVDPSVVVEGGDVLIVSATASALGNHTNINVVAGDDWYNPAWFRRIKLTISDTDIDDNLTDFPMLIDERDLPASFWDEVAYSDGADIRVTAGDGTTLLNHDLGEWVPTSNAFVLRTAVPYISGSDNSAVYLYFNNPATVGGNSVLAYGADAVSHYDFDKNPSTTNQSDRAGAINMEPIGFSTDKRSTGQVGLAFDFAVADSQYMQANDNSDWNFGNASVDTPFSVSVWFDSSLTGTQGLAGKASTSVAGEWSALLTGNRLYFRCIDDSEGSRIGLYSPDTLVADTTYKLDMTYDGSGTTDGFQAYKDGEPWGTFADSSGSYTAMEDTTQTVRVGSIGATHFFDGNISDFTLHGKALDAETVKATYSNEKTASTFYAVGSIETNGALIREETANAIGDTLAPTILAGSLILTTSDSDAIGDTLDPTTLLGNLTLILIQNGAIGDTLNPTIVEGGGLLVSPGLADAIGDTIAPDVLYGSLTASGTASSIGDTLDPTTLLGDLTLILVQSGAVGDTVDPIVSAGGDVLIIATASAVGDTLDPEVLLTSMTVTPSQADAIGDTLDPTIVVSGLTLTRTASAIGDVIAPTVVQSSTTVVSTVSAVGDTVDPEVILASMAVVTVQADAIGGSVDPTVICGSLAISAAASAVGDTVDPTTSIFGGVTVVNAMASAKGDTTGPTFSTVSLGTELDNVARWIFSSVAAHFAPVASSIPLLYHVEGVDERGDEVSRNDSVELRLTGPNIQEVNGKYYSSTEINVLLTNYMKMLEDTYSLVDWTSKFQAEMLERIPIYKLGDGSLDDGSLLGCLLPDSKRGVKAFYFGQIDNVDRIRQSEVDGLYTMELAV